MFVGYGLFSSRYRIHIPREDKIIESKHVTHRIASKFYEEDSVSLHIQVNSMNETILEPQPSTSSTPTDPDKQEIEEKGKTESNNEFNESATDKETAVLNQFMTTRKKGITKGKKDI